MIGRKAIVIEKAALVRDDAEPKGLHVEVTANSYGWKTDHGTCNF
jgi:uncharacterized protein YigE (DUF2233 family)